MKVVLQSYNTSCQNVSGGVNIRIHKIFNLLQNAGVDVSFFCKFNTKLSDVDILHVFRIDSENAELIKCAKQKGVKVIISSIFNITSGAKIDFYRTILNKLPIPTTYKLIFNSLQLADFIIAETKDEANFLKKHFKVKNVAVIPNGVDPFIQSDFDICSSLGLTKKYVLCVGRFDENKNQINLIKAMSGKKESVLFIGGSDGSREGNEYYNKCLEIAKKSNNIFMLGWVEHDSDIVKAAFESADVVVVPSFKETFSLVAVEAGANGTKIVLSKNLPILCFSCFDGCRRINPYNIENIRNVVSLALNDHKDEQMKNKFLNTFSWKTVIEKHIELYEKVLKK